MDGEYVISEEGLDGPRPKESVIASDDSINRFYWIAFWANLGLAVFKITIGALGYSRLLIIDGLNSAANAVLITMILFGINMSHPQKVSIKYPYGTGKAQFFATIIVGFLLAVGASVILVFSIKAFFIPVSLEPVGIGLAAALISIGGNLILIFFLKQNGLMYENKEMQKIACLQSVNIASSTIVAHSLVLSGLFGWFIAERWGSLIISIIVAWLSILIIKHSLDGIMDRSGGKQIESRINALAGSVDKVEDVKWVRTRHSGQNLFIDLKIGLESDCTIRETDQVAAQIRKRLSLDLKGISHVITVDCYPV